MVEPPPILNVLRGDTPKPHTFHQIPKDSLEPGRAFGETACLLLAGSLGGGGGPSPINPNFKSMSEQGRGGSNRRRSHSQSASSRRPPVAPQPSIQTSGLHYAPSSSENVHNAPSTSFQGSTHYPVPYTQRQTYGQYTLSPQSALTMAPPSSPFSYSPGYQHPGVSENLHTSYQMMQPHAPVYQYQQSHSEGSPSTFSTPTMYHPSASSPPPPMYHPSASSPPPPMPPMSPQPPAGPSPPQSPSYSGSGHLSMRYQSAASFAYPPPPQSFPTPPIYQSQYPPNHYPQHFSPSESEGQGIWYYLPHAAASSPSYQTHYPVNYASPLGLQESETLYLPPSSSSSTPALYHRSPTKSPAMFSNSSSPPPSDTPDPDHNSPKPDETASSHAPAVKSIVRRSYHPNPPAHRSEWVMWTGNVPSDANHDELWRFFNHPTADSSEASGVLSIFLISRTNCAFINYESESTLRKAIARFNGQSLRPSDPRCPRLLCRVRRKDDDLKAGVGGQRGMGMHTKWVKDNKGKGTEAFEPDLEDVPSSYSDEQLSTTPSISVSSDDEGRPAPRAKGSSSGSFASTNSSMLSQYFPQRYFILKSLTQYDLDLSVEKCVWATQKHNEGILDQAYRTSKDVYLIFGVNKSGEFYGYARMAGPIRLGEKVSWAQRTDSSSSSRSSLSPVTGRGPIQSDTIPEESTSSSHLPDRTVQLEGAAQVEGVAPFFSPGERQVDDSPMALAERSYISSATAPSGSVATTPKILPSYSAPAEMSQQHQRMSMSPPMKHSLDHQLKTAKSMGFVLDETAPSKAAKNRGPSMDSPISVKTGSVLNSVVEEEEKPMSPANVDDLTRDELWGESFKIEWLSTKRLPFYRTRHIRNPWNHEREVKVSRDGTELEPSVGQQLIEEWDNLVDTADSTMPDVVTKPRRGGSASKTGAPLLRKEVSIS